MKNDKSVDYNSKRRAAYPLKNEQQKAINIFKDIKSNEQNITYGKFTSIWLQKYRSDFFLGQLKVAQLCGGGNISDKNLQSYMKKIFLKYYDLYKDYDIDKLAKVLDKIPYKTYLIELPADKKEVMDRLHLFIKCEDDSKKGKKYFLLRRRKSKPARIIIKTSFL